MEKMHQQISIDLTLDGQSSPWCNIKHQTGKTGEKTYVFGPQTLIGMYENGKVERTLFNMNRQQLEQLRDVLNMLCPEK